MDVVIPLRGGVERPAGGIAREVVRLVAVVLEHEVHAAVAARSSAQRRCDLADHIGPARVAKGVHRVEPQPVEAIFRRPVERVVHEIIAYCAARGSVEIDCRAPGRALRRVEELRAIGVQIVAVRTEMVVDHIEQHHHSCAVGGIDEGLQLVGCAVASRRRERQHTVVPPVAHARKCRQRHELQRVDAERRQFGQPGGRGSKAACRRERADVQLIDHGIRPRPSAPRSLAPGVRARIHDAARLVHSIRIAARGGIRHRPGGAVLEMQAKFVARAGLGLGHRDLVPAGLGGVHRAGTCLDQPILD